MATAKFVEKAKKPIYKRGKRVEYISQRGKHKGEIRYKIDRSQPADETDEILINVGESYYTWCFYGGQPIYSRNRPRPSQLTNNSFYQELYSIQEKIDDYEPEDTDDVASFVEEVIGDLESLRDECQERFDNIPEQLQESSDGAQILQQRIEDLEGAISEFENINTVFESEIDEDARDEDMTDEDWEGNLQQERDEWCENVMDEIRSVGLDF